MLTKTEKMKAKTKYLLNWKAQMQLSLRDKSEN